jgi:hypothetical protein
MNSPISSVARTKFGVLLKGLQVAQYSLTEHVTPNMTSRRQDAPPKLPNAWRPLFSSCARTPNDPQVYLCDEIPLCRLVVDSLHKDNRALSDRDFFHGA